MREETQAEPLIRLLNISKHFPGVVAVDDATLDIYPGEVQVIAGENGAGKVSTSPGYLRCSFPFRV